MTVSVTARLREIEECVEKATEGPWETTGDSELEEWYAEFFQVQWPNPQAFDGNESVVLTFTERDALFIAHARQDVPFLLALLRESRPDLFEKGAGE